jgi:uncharacterized protein YbaP (TraB family)
MRLLAASFLLLAIAHAPPAQAACRGTNMLDALARSDPTAYSAIVAAAGTTPNGEGRFWRVQRHGISPSHLFGTFHTDQAVATVPDDVWQALAAARLALFELSAGEREAMEARLASDPGFAFDRDAPPLSRRLDPGSLAVIREALGARGIPLEQAEQMRPWLLFSLLGFPACHLQALSAGARSLDEIMTDRAMAAGTPHDGLETYEGAIAAFGRVAPERFLAILVETSGLADREEDIFRTNLDLYAQGRIGAIDAFARWLSMRPPSRPEDAALYEEVMAELIGGRNRAWLDLLELELARGGAFVAVGALHLPGEEGLIGLLRARGWTVTRLDRPD